MVRVPFLSAYEVHGGSLNLHEPAFACIGCEKLRLKTALLTKKQ